MYPLLFLFLIYIIYLHWLQVWLRNSSVDRRSVVVSVSMLFYGVRLLLVSLICHCPSVLLNQYLCHLDVLVTRFFKWIVSPDRPARSSVAIPTELPGPLSYYILQVFCTAGYASWIVTCLRSFRRHTKHWRLNKSLQSLSNVRLCLLAEPKAACLRCHNQSPAVVWLMTPQHENIF
jgi:hypothetical protein